MNTHKYAPTAVLLALAGLAGSVMAPAYASSTTLSSPHADATDSAGVIVWTNAASLEGVDVTGQLVIANADGSDQRQLTPVTAGATTSTPPHAAPQRHPLAADSREGRSPGRGVADLPLTA